VWRPTYMSEDSNPGESRNDDGNAPRNNKQYVVFVDGTKAKFEDSTVEARDLIAVVFPDDADAYDLVALRGEGGPEEAVFAPGDTVNLDEQHRKHFDTKGDGRNYV
jgi:hypothetical protein